MYALVFAFYLEKNPKRLGILFKKIIVDVSGEDRKFSGDIYCGDKKDFIARSSLVFLGLLVET